MKTLLIMRHAKSSHDDPDQLDFDRPLDQRGRTDAPRMGEFLKRKQIVPNLIVGSSATRTQETAKLVAKACGYRGEFEFHKDLYLSPAKSYIDVAKKVKVDGERILIIGHNPALEELLLHLTGNREHMPTAAIAQVNLAVNHWREFDTKARGKLQSIWLPRELE